MFWIENDFLLDSSAEACSVRVLRRPVRAPAPEFFGRLAEARAPFDCPRTAASLRSSLCLRVILSLYPRLYVQLCACMYIFVHGNVPEGTLLPYPSRHPARSS